MARRTTAGPVLRWSILWSPESDPSSPREVLPVKVTPRRHPFGWPLFYAFARDARTRGHRGQGQTPHRAVAALVSNLSGACRGLVWAVAPPGVPLPPDDGERVVLFVSGSEWTGLAPEARAALKTGSDWSKGPGGFYTPPRPRHAADALWRVAGLHGVLLQEEPAPTDTATEGPGADAVGELAGKGAA